MGFVFCYQAAFLSCTDYAQLDVTDLKPGTRPKCRMVDEWLLQHRSAFTILREGEGLFAVSADSFAQPDWVGIA